VVLLVAAVIAQRWKRPSPPPDANSQKIQVTASFYPLYYFASTIGGEDAVVTNITPAGVEPHEYEPTPQDIVRLEHSKLLILNGARLEPWAEKIGPTLEQKGVVIVEAGREAVTKTVEENGQTVQDPHVWLSPVAAQQEVDAIVAGFAKADPSRASSYQMRASELKARLVALDQQYRQGLSECAKRNFITSHNAFGYLAGQYALNQVSIAGLSPDMEPSAKELARIAQLARYYQVRIIFFESLVSPKFSQTIATSIGAQTMMLNPLEGLSEEELAQGKDYFTEMKSNLENLRVALECR